MKKILLVTTVPETFSTILVGQPRYLNDFFCVRLASSLDRNSDFLKSEGVPIVSVPMKRGISPFFDFISLAVMMFQILRFRPDIVHSYTPKAGLIAMLASFMCRVPVRIHTFTGLIFPTSVGLKRHVLMLVDRLICFCATTIVPEGEGVKNDLVSARVTKKSLSVIGFGNIAGVDTDFFDRSIYFGGAETFDLRRELSIDADEFVFCYVGRLNRDKGIKELVTAFLKLPCNARLILVGGEDKEAPVCDSVMEIIEEASNINWVGFQADIRPALICSDVLVLPSYREGFPNVVLQAGAMRVPVIATDINGSNEIIEHGLNGWLVPPKTISELYSAMLIAMQTSVEERMEMGSLARRRVEERFERKEHWERMLKFYECLLSNCAAL